MKKIFVIMIIAAGLMACRRNVLDIPPQDRIAENVVWTDPNLVAAYQNSLYNGIPHGFYLHMYSKYSDEAINTAPCCGANIFAQNTYNPDNIAQANSGDFWGGYMYYWTYGYQYIRQANVFLQKMAAPGSLSFTSKAQLVAETHFLRAFMYFNLIERYGAVPIVDTAYTLGDSANFKRNTFDECVAFIVAECDAAAAVLPVGYSSGAAELGRATKAAALALKSKALLYAASPLWNPSNDKQKWQLASDAAKAVIDLPGYQLYTGGYENIFTTWNSEILMARQGNKQYQWNAFQGVEMFLAPCGFHGWSSFAPSQNLVDAFGTADGKDITDATSGYNPQQPYVNRDPRFYSDIIFDGKPYGKPDFFKDRYAAGHSNIAEMYEGGLDSQQGWDTWNASMTRYSFRKYQDTTFNFNVETQTNKFWIISRLAEIYLNYAEAEFNLGHEAVSRQYLDLLRHRAGIVNNLPGSLTGAALLAKIQNERRVELCLEGQRYYDVRRWKIADVTENTPLGGVKIVKNPDGSKTYTYIKVQDRVFKSQHYLLPIPREEIRRTNLPQNPGYN